MRAASMVGVLFRGAAVIAIAAAAIMANGNTFAAAPPAAERADTRAMPSATLTPFRSEADLQRYFKRRKDLAQRNAPPPPAPPPPSSMAADSVASAPVTVTAGRAASAPQQPGITNNQEANVDEGDIVKMHGNELVVLRRGRLFTVSLVGGTLRPIDSINAYPPGVDAQADWYDEMLVGGDRVIVIGYSYGRGGTEINRFHIDARGHLRWEDAYHLRSNDYYSSRNYASRLIGHKLILYSPLYMNPWSDDPMVSFPALRKWTGNTNAAWRRIVSATQVYTSPRLDARQVQAVHTVTSCDLSAPVLDCSATSVLGPAGRTFYVSSHAVYVWTTAYWWGGRGDDGSTPSVLFRLPLDGSAPSAVGVSGSPVDQFSFREDYDDGMVNILVRAEGAGDAMWAPEHSAGAIALMRMPIRSFGDGSRDVSINRYKPLPQPEGNGYDFHNRFVGDYVLYGNGNGWGRPNNTEAELVVAPVKGGEGVQLPLEHGVDRIEVMGSDAVIVGSDRNSVYFTAVDLDGRQPHIGSQYVMEGAAQAETRSHGFFFKQEGADSSGVLGLPVARPARAAYRQLFDTSAAIVFVRRGHDGQFSPLGTLDAHPEDARDDDCVASCVDWYGNARPIFLGDRTFALMGYEVVEGDLNRRTVREVGRANFAPDRRHLRDRPTN